MRNANVTTKMKSSPSVSNNGDHPAMAANGNKSQKDVNKKEIQHRLGINVSRNILHVRSDNFRKNRYNVVDKRYICK